MLRSTCDSAAKLMTASTPFPRISRTAGLVAYVALDELVSGIILQAGQVFEIARIREFIQIQYPIVRISFQDISDKI